MAVQDEASQQFGDGQEQEHLRCPITLALYRDPVVVESGNTYERSAIILHWAKRGHPHDPLNNTALTSDVMLPNWDKRRQVQDFLGHCRAKCPSYVPDGWDTVNVHIPQPAPFFVTPLGCFQNFCQRLVFLIVFTFLLTAGLQGAFLPGHKANSMFVLFPGDDVELVTAELLRRPRDAKLQIRALEAMAFLARDNTENRMAILKDGGIGRIVSAMGGNLDDPEIQGLGCWSLGNLASNSAENSAAIARAGGIQHIIAASYEHLKDVSVQVAAVWAIWNLSLHPTSREIIIRTRGVDQILSAMKQHLRVPHVQLHACGALRSLASDSSQREALAKAGAIEAIIEAIIEHPEYQELQSQACGALQALTLSSSLNNDVITAFWNSKIHRAALGKTNKGLVGAPWNLDIAFAHKEWLKTLVDRPLDLLAQCGALMNSTTDASDNPAARVWASGVSRLVAAMDQRSSNLTMHAWLRRRLEH